MGPTMNPVQSSAYSTKISIKVQAVKKYQFLEFLNFVLHNVVSITIMNLIILQNISTLQ